MWKSLNAGGFWIVGRTAEEGDARNHVTILARTDSGWRIGGRIAGGSDIEDLILCCGNELESVECADCDDDRHD